MKELIQQITEFLEVYVENSSIESITYNSETKKWVIKYNYDTPDDEFHSTKEMIHFLHKDQFGS